MVEVCKENTKVQTEVKSKFSARRILQFLVLCILALVSISTFLSFLKFQVPVKSKNLINIGLTFFSLDRERNIPTYFSSFVLLGCSIILFYIFFFRKKDKAIDQWYWGLLAFIFLILSLDEFVGFHELTAGPIKEILNLSGLLSFGWVIPAFFIVFILGIVILKFLLSLNIRFRYGFIISGGLYVGGVLGMELVGGYLMDTVGADNFAYALCTNIEETLEMLGVFFFIYTLLKYIHFIKPNGLHVWIKS